MKKFKKIIRWLLEQSREGLE